MNNKLSKIMKKNGINIILPDLNMLILISTKGFKKLVNI